MKASISAARVYLLLQASLLKTFHPLMQAGVDVETPTGISVQSFLCSELGLPSDYPDTHIQTVFLNGKAVDDLHGAFIGNGSTLALSAAMPGLLGATLRRKSVFAAMRREISHGDHAQSSASEKGRIRVKIFNLLLDDFGRILLGRGVWVAGRDLQDLFVKLGEPFWSECREARLNGAGIEPAALGKMNWGEKEIFLKVATAD